MVGQTSGRNPPSQAARDALGPEHDLNQPTPHPGSQSRVAAAEVHVVAAVVAAVDVADVVVVGKGTTVRPVLEPTARPPVAAERR